MPRKVTPERIKTVIEKILTDYNDETLQSPKNRFADTTIKIDGDQLIVTYDGAGYDYLSMESDAFYQNFGPRVEITKFLQGIGYIIEDRNSWSFTVREK